VESSKTGASGKRVMIGLEVLTAVVINVAIFWYTKRGEEKRYDEE
jgi:hypothetical protein